MLVVCTHLARSVAIRSFRTCSGTTLAQPKVCPTSTLLRHEQRREGLRRYVGMHARPGHTRPDSRLRPLRCRVCARRLLLKLPIAKRLLNPIGKSQHFNTISF